MGEKPIGKRMIKALKDDKEKVSHLKALAGKLVLLILALVIPLFLLEAAVMVFLTFPALAKWGSPKIVRAIYENDYRSIIQFDPAFARYDAELTYTLRPGIFHFRNPEFDAEYHVNRLGLRDEEDALVRPEVIVIGDSEAMGWGIKQGESYSKIIEKRKNIKVLNAAVSSYGTVREMRLLDRLDRSKMRYLVIHYMDNDYIENHFFYRNSNVLRISSPDEYNHYIALHAQLKRYYPGKYVHLSLKYAFEQWKARRIAPSSTSADTMGENAEICFLNAVMKASGVDLRPVQIIVVASERDSDFSVRLKNEIRRDVYPEFIRGIRVVSPASRMDRDCYFALDDHMQVKGHEIIADEVIKAMNAEAKP